MRAAHYYGPDLAFIHDAGYSDFGGTAARGLVRLLRAAGIRRGRIVELGCGAGAATRRLVAAGHEVLAIDASPAMLRLARRTGGVDPGLVEVAGDAAGRVAAGAAVLALGL